MPARVTKARKKTTVKKKDKPDGYVFGRPTLYKKEYCQRVIEIMKDGGSQAECAAEFYIAKATFFEWVKTYPDFKDAVSIGKTLSEAWWTKKGQTHITHTSKGTQLNGGVYGLHMKNRHGWSDKKEVQLDATEEVKKSLAFDLSDKPKHRGEK